MWYLPLEHVCILHATVDMYLTRLSGLSIGTLEYQFEGSFIVILWALRLCLASR